MARSLSLIFCLITSRAPAGAGDAKLDYSRDIQPILARNCFACHGPDTASRRAGLRLDLRAAALQTLDSGNTAIVPGKPAESELVRRIGSPDRGVVMPPPRSRKNLTAAEKASLKTWIEQGAAYRRHWALVPPRRPPLPRVTDRAWPRNPIDSFVLARLEAEGLRPAIPAERTTLIRRVTLDLSGLPPTPAEVDAFVADNGPDAYEKLVDRLLASPRYGERMALEWLDAARYADTHGFHRDGGRAMWRWREWVIDAFNRNLPFDRFTIEQLAGDLLPAATLEQRIASGFQRNHMINVETGASPDEYRNAYVVDRVNTIGTVWLGLTVACCQCHDHKFDPLTQREYYQLYAFFNNVPENGIDGAAGNAAPLLKLPTPAQRQTLERLAASIQDLERRSSGPPAEAQRLGAQLARLRRASAELDRQIPSTMVMEEMAKPRDTFVLLRGQYDKRGVQVTAGVPACLPPLPQGAPANRLGLARWLVDPAHPLTARVMVNRIWQMCFGTGIVKTAEDFGSQGEWPSHPELLDWLACEFASPASGRDAWDIKRMQRLIVTSAAYRQASAATAELLARDPENRLLARGPRVRLPAELIRDQALAIGGLLDGTIGGPSVLPYQPAGLWEELASRLDGANFSAQVYVQGHGRDLYRRSIYTFWKRTAPPPGLSSLDAPDRETCTVRRARTDTPLQALVLMNDPTYLEAARKLAERTMSAAASTDERIAFAFRLAAARRPKPGELMILRQVFDEQLAAYRRDKPAALKLLRVGESRRDERLDPSELAAWTVVASAILNLDETITKG